MMKNTHIKNDKLKENRTQNFILVDNYKENQIILQWNFGEEATKSSF